MSRANKLKLFLVALVPGALIAYHIAKYTEDNATEPYLILPPIFVIILALVFSLISYMALLNLQNAVQYIRQACHKDTKFRTIRKPLLISISLTGVALFVLVSLRETMLSMGY